MALQPGQQVGRYRVVRMLAQGGMAEVYRAEQELAAGMFRPAALKVIRPEYLGSPEFREMFLDEARTASTLSHSNIAHIYDVGEEHGLVYMAMELVPGQTLAVVCRTLRQSGDRLSDEGLLAVGIHTCSALEAVHALKLPGEGHLNLVHRDVSPHNLLLSSSGSLKLIDFGIAKADTNRNLTLPGITKGKAGYFSPEQARGKALDGRSDLFSLGVTLYKLASGGTPFDEHRTHQARNHALVHGRWVPLQKACPGLPAAFYEIVARALQVRPEDRFSDAKAMRIALEEAAVDAGLLVGPGSLAGYVTDEDEAGPAAPATQQLRSTVPHEARAQAVQPPRAPPPAGARRHTERFSPAGAQGRPRLGLRIIIAVAVFCGAALAGLGVLLAFRPPAPPLTPAPEPTSGVPVATGVAPAAPDLPGEIPSSGRAIHDADPLPGGPVPRAQLAPPRKPKAPREPAAEERIPKGIGKLRVGAVPEGTVSVGSEVWGQAPVDRKVASGQYRVNVAGARGQRGTCLATVLPDKTTIVIYDFGARSCR